MPRAPLPPPRRERTGTCLAQSLTRARAGSLCATEPFRAAQLLSEFWKISDGPWVQLLEDESRMHETLNICNASEVIEGFAFCAAGLRKRVLRPPFPTSPPPAPRRSAAAY